MDITQYIITPKDTPERAPLETIIKLTKGRLNGGALYFPSGPAGTLHFIARIGIHQIIPFNTGQSIALNNCVIPLSLGFTIEEPPFLLSCFTWNDSTLYDHALTIVLHLDPHPADKMDLDALIDRFYNYRT